MEEEAAISLLGGVLISWSHNEFLEKSVTTELQFIKENIFIYTD